MNPVGFLNLVFCVVMAFRSARRRELVAIYWTAAVWLAGLPLTFPSLVNFEERSSHTFADSTIYTSALFVLVFHLLFTAAAARVRPGRKSAGVPLRLKEFSPAQLALLRRSFLWVSVAFVACAPALIRMTTGSLFSIGGYKWTDSAVMYEGQTQYGFVIANTCFTVFSFAATLAFLLRRRLILLVLLAMAFLTAQVLGSRVFFLPAVLSVATLLGLRLVQFRKRRSPWRLAAGVVAAAVVLTVTYEGLAFVAWARSRFDVATLAGNLGQAWGTFSETSGARLDASSGAMLYSFEVFPSGIPYCRGLSYGQMALAPIPVSLLRKLGFAGLKTWEFSGIILARDLYGLGYESRFGSIHPTIWGDAYANFGPLGALVGAFWGIVFGGLERILRGRPALCVAALPTYAGFVIVLVRGSMLHAAFYLFNDSMMLGLLLFLLYLLKAPFYRVAVSAAAPRSTPKFRRPVLVSSPLPHVSSDQNRQTVLAPARP